MEKQRLTDKISDKIGISRDIISNASRIVILGNGIVHIEGFFGIPEYENDRISVKIRDGICSVGGEGLEIGEITEEYIDLRGRVKTVEFM